MKNLFKLCYRKIKMENIKITISIDVIVMHQYIV